MALSLSSPDFGNGKQIPEKFTCMGEDTSPRLIWQNVPAGTKSLALVCSDPDAPGGTYQHWAAWDIPANWPGLDAGYGKHHLGGSFAEAINDFGNRGYGGPCPPVGHGRHRYYFRLSALSVDRLDLLPEGAKCVDVIRAAEPVAIARAEWMGTFERKK